MHDPRDIVSLSVGVTTAGVGALGLTVVDVQMILSIIASGSGILLTVMTLWWRRAENKRRVKEFEDYQKRIEHLEEEAWGDTDDREREDDE